MNFQVIAADGAHARFFTLPTASPAANESGPHLVELDVLVNPEQEAAGTQLWSDDTGGRQGSPGGAHGYDDHREHHRLEYERRFAAMVAWRALEHLQGKADARLVIAADKRMLGLLRDALAGRHEFEVREVAKDYCKLSAAELHGHLAEAGLLPPSHKPGH